MMLDGRAVTLMHRSHLQRNCGRRRGHPEVFANPTSRTAPRPLICRTANACLRPGISRRNGMDLALMTRIRPRWRFALPVLTLASVLACIAAPATATAAPPYLKFLEGLRERGYEDMALAYLDQLEADASVPQDVKD